jgi:hypothetical protein
MKMVFFLRKKLKKRQDQKEKKDQEIKSLHKFFKK